MIKNIEKNKFFYRNEDDGTTKELGKFINFDLVFIKYINDRYNLNVKFLGKSKEIYTFNIYGSKLVVEIQLNLLFERVIKDELHINRIRKNFFDFIIDDILSNKEIEIQGGIVL